MRSWNLPAVPDLSSHGRSETPRVYDSSRAAVIPIVPERRTAADGSGGPDAAPDAAAPFRLYVCGITPYDATHMGHAATYITLDILQRAVRDAGHDVIYAQNVTDIDDPLLERALRDGIDWRDLAKREIQLFRDDMEALRVIPPQDYVGVVERMDSIAAGVTSLLDAGSAYELVAQDAAQAGAKDVYLDLSTTPDFGAVSGWSRQEMLGVFADRGGDPDRPGKRDVLDPLLWRAARPGEPSWSAAGLDAGRPGWHIECTCIAIDSLGPGFDVQGGGIDLVFPHHEMSAAQAEALHGPGSFARAYVHQEMVGLDGAKMSKSKGNLVLVSRLRAQGVDPRAIRLVLLDHHYRTPWDWTDDVLGTAQHRLTTWCHGIGAVTTEQAQVLLGEMRRALADDLNTPAALRAVDACLAQSSYAPAEATGEPALVRDILDALLGIHI